uniref:L1 transposable element RRM domain-containing protein n=1 Tax=Equus caballus TaxID=9796 RepID=A0A9L0SCT8_HORSE
MQRHKSMDSNSMKKYIKSPDQKENDKHPEINPEGTEIYNLNDKEFKIAVILKTQPCARKHRQFNEIRNFTKELETIKKNLSEILEMKNTSDELEKNPDSLNNRADIVEKRISSLEHTNIEMLQMEERELILKRNEEILQEIPDSIRKCNIKIIGIPEREEKEKGAESLLKEMIAENFANLEKEPEIQVKEANRSPNDVNVKRPSPRHIVVKLAKVNDKEKILKAARQKKITYRGTPIRLSVDFSAETLQARREWNDIFKILKDKNIKPRILCPAKISFRYDGEIKTFPGKQKLFV